MAWATKQAGPNARRANFAGGGRWAAERPVDRGEVAGTPDMVGWSLRRARRTLEDNRKRARRGGGRGGALRPPPH